MTDETFFGYQDIGEVGFIEWSLAYTFEWIIECYQAIPVERRYEPLAAGDGAGAGRLTPACSILGHIALNEEGLLKGFAQGIAERTCPVPRDACDVFRTVEPDALRRMVPDTEVIVDYWRAVRAETLAFLRTLTAEQLRSRPASSTLAEGDPNRDNPIRELFLMAISHQNCHWGELRATAKLLSLPVR